MNKDFVQNWLNNLKEFWFGKDIESAVSLFKNTTFYQETPFMEPYTTMEEINENPSYIDFLTAILHEVIECDRTGDLLVINILVDILQNYKKL